MEDSFGTLKITWWQRIYNWHKRYIATIDKTIGISALLILLYSLIYYFLLVEIPEVIPHTAKLGEFIYPICLSFLAAFIFYFWTVHYPKCKVKEGYIMGVIASIARIKEYCKFYISEPLKNIYEYQFADDYPTDEEWDESVKNWNGKNINWTEKFNSLIPYTRFECDKLVLLGEYFPKLTLHIYNILNTAIITSEAFYKDSQLRPDTYSDYAFNPQIIKDYLNVIKELDNYYNEELIPTLFRDKHTIK